MSTITLPEAEDDALEKAYITTAGRMLAQIAAICNAPNSQLQRSLKKLDDEADRLTEAEEVMTPDNPQLEQTLGVYEDTFKATQALIMVNDNAIQDTAARLAIPAVTAKVFSVLTGAMLSRGINPLSPQGTKILTSRIAASGIPWTTPGADVFAANYVDSTAWINRMENWGKGYADYTRDTFLRGVQSGWGPKYTAGQVRVSAQNLPKSAAESLTRTLQITSYQDASAEMEKVNNKYITGKIRIATLNQTCCLNCISRHGEQLEVGARVDDHFRGRCTAFYQVPGGPQYPESMQADSTPGNRNFVPFQKGEDWFNSLPPERQAQQASFLKSPAKLRAYRDGTPLSAFVGDHTDSVFGDQVVEKSLKDAIGLKRAQGYYSINQAKGAGMDLFIGQGSGSSGIDLDMRQGHLDDIAKSLDYSGKVIYETGKPSDLFSYLPDGAGAAYNHTTKNIHVWDAAFESGEDLKGILAHEITHPVLIDLDTKKTMGILEEIYSSVSNPSGDLEFFFMQNDGFTEYSQYSWMNNLMGDESFIGAFRETICEISGIDAGGLKTIKPVNKLWRDVYNKTMAAAKAEAERKAISDAAFKANSKALMEELKKEFGL